MRMPMVMVSILAGLLMGILTAVIMLRRQPEMSPMASRMAIEDDQ